MGFFIVGVTGTCKRLAVCATLAQSEAYVGTLPNVEKGIYYIDGPCTEAVTLDAPTDEEVR